MAVRQTRMILFLCYCVHLMKRGALLSPGLNVFVLRTMIPVCSWAALDSAPSPELSALFGTSCNERQTEALPIKEKQREMEIKRAKFPLLGLFPSHV